MVDSGERATGLVEAVSSRWERVNVRRLCAGDVAVGPNILIERKTQLDLRFSLEDGRLFRQLHAIAEVAFRPLLLIEGSPDACWHRERDGGRRGLLLTVAAGYRIPTIFSRSVDESGRLIGELAAQEERRLRRIGRLEQRPKLARSPKRPTQVTRELLLAIPGIGPGRAATIASRVPSIADLINLTESDLATFPGIGKTTAQTILRALRSK